MNIMKVIGIIVLLILFGVGIKACGLVGWFVGGAEQLVKQELHPKEIQRKYEWFKDASARLDSLSQQIEVSRETINQTKADYGTDASKWPRDVRQEMAQLRAEMRGIIGIYNRLQADYNSQSSKWNWEYFEGKKPLKKNYKRFSE